MRITLAIDGVEVVDRALARYVARLTDATPAFEDIGRQLADNNTATFAQQGQGWAPLSARYAAYKVRHFPGRPILVRTGALRDSLTQRPFGIDRVLPQSGTFGSAARYGRYHQQGTPRMPARPPLDVTEQTRKTMAKTLQRYIVGQDR